MLNVLPQELIHYHVIPNLDPTERLLWNIAIGEGLPLSYEDKFQIVQYAAGNGHLRLLRWAIAGGAYWQDEKVSVAAAGGGHLAMLKYLRINGCPWNADVCLAAAAKGHLEVLKWLRANGCPWNKNVCSSAARSGHLFLKE